MGRLQSSGTGRWLLLQSWLEGQIREKKKNWVTEERRGKIFGGFPGAGRGVLREKNRGGFAAFGKRNRRGELREEERFWVRKDFGLLVRELQ